MPEKQLLLDRHLVVECYRFYHNKRPFEYGLKQLIYDDDEDKEDGDHLAPHRVKYDKRRMGSNEADPECSNMTAMLASIICSGGGCILPIADKRILSDSKIWMKFLEDGQNPAALAKIICHFAAGDLEYSRKTMKHFVAYLEDYNDNVYNSSFVVLRALFSMRDYEEKKGKEEESTFEIVSFSNFRIEKFLGPILKIMRDWYRDNKYPQSVAKIAQFIDECAQTNDAFSSYFRIKSANLNVVWFRQFLNSHSYYLTMPKPPE